MSDGGTGERRDVSETDSASDRDQGQPSQPLAGLSPEQPESAAPALMDGRVDLAVAVATVAFGVALIVLAENIPVGSIPDPIGSNGLPRLVGGFLIITAGVVAVRRFLAMRRQPGVLVPADGGATDEPGYPGSALRAFGLLAGAFLWALLLERVGYVPMTLLLVGGALASMGIRSPVKLTLFPIAFVVVMWALFGELLNLNLPTGLFGDLTKGLF